MLLFLALQLVLDLVLVALAISYILQKRRLLRLETDLHCALLELERREKSSEALNTPLGVATSTLSERLNSGVPETTSSAGSSSNSLSASARYTLAQKLLNDGVAASEAARKSGVSETELSLLRKFAQAPKKNSEVH
jgi:hypothetical protein